MTGSSSTIASSTLMFVIWMSEVANIRIHFHVSSNHPTYMIFPLKKCSYQKLVWNLYCSGICNTTIFGN